MINYIDIKLNKSRIKITKFYKNFMKIKQLKESIISFNLNID